MDNNPMVIKDVMGYEYISHTHSWLVWRQATHNFKRIKELIGKDIFTREEFIEAANYQPKPIQSCDYIRDL